MKPLLLFLVFALCSLNLVHAQDAEGWPIVQRCIERATEPPDDWTFAGTIFTFKRGDGLHAYRADVPSRYYIAFDSDSELAIVGAFSPDGRWFAVPAGRSEYATMLDTFFHVEQIRVYSTVPSHEEFAIEWSYLGRMSTSARLGVPMPNWIDNHQFVYPTQRDGLAVIDPFQNTVAGWAGDQSEPSIKYLWDVTPSEVEEITFQSDGEDTAEVILPARSSEGSVNLYTVSATASGRFIVTYDTSLKVISLDERIIYDTCVALAVYDDLDYWVISPVSDQVAFNGAGGFVYILDIPTWQAYRLNLAANLLVGWYITE